jgi:hypothetical protein
MNATLTHDHLFSLENKTKKIKIMEKLWFNISSYSHLEI